MSAGRLVTVHGLTVTLQDGGGIGWTLCALMTVPSVGDIGLECVPDPDMEICLVHVPADVPDDAADPNLQALGLTDADVLQFLDGR